MKFAFALLAALFLPLGVGRSAETLSAQELASQLAAFRENGSALVRLRMETAGTTLQVQVRERRSPQGADVLYQILWPRERKGEAVVLNQSSNGAVKGFTLLPDGSTPSVHPEAPLFGSAMAAADTIENPYAWKNQSLAGTESIDGVDCVVLESKPGSGEHSIYSKVRSWIDTRRIVPLKVEKFLPAGKLARTFTTTRVFRVDSFNTPANLTVEDPQSGAKTTLEGSRIERDATFTDSEFSLETLRTLIPTNQKKD